jgi:hypothetical protein
MILIHQDSHQSDKKFNITSGINFRITILKIVPLQSSFGVINFMLIFFFDSYFTKTYIGK